VSRENVDLIRGGFEAFARGDLQWIIDRVDPDVEWAPGIAPILGVETMRGKEELRRFLGEELFDGFDEFRAEALSFEDLGDTVLVQSRYSGRGESSGLEIDQVFHTLYVVRGGRIVSMRDYDTRAEAVAAAAG
jgi:ketosteroid isomerase-like protein